MKKIIIAILAVAIIGAGSAFWYFGIREDDSLEVSTQKVDTLQSANGLSEANSPDGDWEIKQQEDVFVGYEIEELFGGDSIKKTAVSKTEEVSGTLNVQDLVITSAKITADLSQLESDSSRRDSTQENQGLETNKFPEAIFEVSEPTELGEFSKKQDFEIELRGNLTLHGVTKNVTIPLVANWDGIVIVVTGELEIKLSDFEIEPPDSSFVKVDDSGKIKLQLLFVPNS